MPIWDDGTLEYPIRNERHLISRRAVAHGEAQRARRAGAQRRRGPPWMELENEGRRHRSDLSKTRREGENEPGFPFSPSEIVEKENAPVPSHPKCENGFLAISSSLESSRIIISVLFIMYHSIY